MNAVPAGSSAAPNTEPQPNLPPDPQPGDIGVVPIRGDVGWLISLAQRLNGDAFAQYDHAFVCVAEGFIAEAEPGGARVASLTEYDPRTIAWIRCPAEHRQAVADAAREFANLHIGYSAADYFALAAHRLRLPIPGLTRFVLSEKRMICSQLAVTAARRGGWDLLDPIPAGFVTPAELGALAEPPA